MPADARPLRDTLGWGPEIVDLLLPHRPPIRLVDRVLAYTPGERVDARKLVSSNEPVLAGHFPGRPIWPGVYTLEALAQTAGILLGLNAACEQIDGGWDVLRRQLSALSAHRRMQGAPVDPDVLASLGGLAVTGMIVSADVRWRRPVFPGDVLDLAASNPRSTLGMVQVEVEARVGGERAANGRITVAPQAPAP